MLLRQYYTTNRFSDNFSNRFVRATVAATATVTATITATVSAATVLAGDIFLKVGENAVKNLVRFENLQR